jgi:probable addiction module antidote protein
MAPETLLFDAADYLTNAKAQAELLTDALETGDAGYIANALWTIVRTRGMAQVARDAGVTRASLYKALSTEGDPQLTTLLGVVRALGIKLTAQPI